MDFVMKYIDGTPVEPEYLEKVAELVAEVCDIEEKVSIFDLDN